MDNNSEETLSPEDRQVIAQALAGADPKTNEWYRRLASVQTRGLMDNHWHLTPRGRRLYEGT